MGLYQKNGTRWTKSALTAQTAAEADPLIVVAVDVYERVPLMHELGPDAGVNARTEGSQLKLKWKAGKVIRTSVFNRLFPTPTAAISPAGGGTGGGTLVTITGSFLDGTSDVTFGGTSGTSLTVVSPTKVTVLSPAKTAGAKDVVVVTPNGSVTLTGAFTYA